MKKSTKGEAVLSALQIQAARLNKLESHRLQRHVTFLREDYQDQINRIEREQKELKLHLINVVRVIRPNQAYEFYKQAHAREIAQEEAEELIESMKLKQKSKPKIHKQIIPSSPIELPSESLRPLLLLVGDNNKKSIDLFRNNTENFLRPKTSPNNQHLSPQHRINPLLTMLHGRPFSSNNVSRQQQQQQQYDSPSFYSLSSTGTTGSRKLIQGKFVTTHKKSDLDALHRMALQNQTAYRSVAQTRIEDRKLHDKEFASQHRALKGSMRSAGVVN